MADTRRKAGALGILASVVASTVAVLWWPTPAARIPASAAGQAASQTWTLPSLVAPSATPVDHHFSTPRLVVAHASRPPVARPAGLRATSSGAAAPESDPIAVPVMLESRGRLETSLVVPAVVPALPPVAAPIGSATARTRRALANAFKTAGTSVGAAFSRAF